MPDITMCTNDDCPRHEFCWRHNAPYKTDGSQSWFHGKWDEDGWDCEYFIPMPHSEVGQ